MSTARRKLRGVVAMLAGMKATLGESGVATQEEPAEAHVSALFDVKPGENAATTLRGTASLPTLSSEHKQIIIAIKRLSDYMAEHGKGVIQLFNEFDREGDGKLSRDELHSALCTLSLQITPQQATSLVQFMDKDGDGEINVKELDCAIRLYKRRKREGKLDAWHGELDAPKDEVRSSSEVLFKIFKKLTLLQVFPNWLIDRVDFRLVFARFMEEGERNWAAQTKVSFMKRSSERTHEDLQNIAHWLSKQPSLAPLGARRYLEFASVVKWQEAPPGEIIFQQGEKADAFYMLYSGEVSVWVDGAPVVALHAGETFGELGLDNGQPRTATVCVSAPGASLIRMKAEDYCNLMTQYNIALLNQKMGLLAEFNAEHGGRWSVSKMRALAYNMVPQHLTKGQIIYDQGASAASMFFVSSGVVLLQQDLKFRQPGRNFSRISCSSSSAARFTINIQRLKRGACFGNFATHPCRATSASEKTDVFAIPRVSILGLMSSTELEEIATAGAEIARLGNAQLASEYYWAVKRKQRIFQKKRQALGSRYEHRLEVATTQMMWKSSSNPALRQRRRADSMVVLPPLAGCGGDRLQPSRC